jgi:signal transduction histidine kinase
MVGRVTDVHILGRLVSAPAERRSRSRRLTGFVAAIAGPAAMTGAALPFRDHLGLAGFLLFTLIVVLVVALRSGFAASLVAVVTGILCGGYFFIAPYDSLRVYLRVSDVPLVAYLIVGTVLGLLVDDLATVAGQQRELRREITVSRARIVAAADDARRQIERDLHDGAQQRIVALALGLRTAQMSVPAELQDLSQELSVIADGLSGATEDLREMARGIHPSILAEGGIAPALRTLARRSAVPVELTVNADGRLPAPVEVAAYYVVSESLTNIAKHAGASQARIVAELSDTHLTIIVSDDGNGDVDASRGSGITGLTDRVEALGGTIVFSSAPGGGTQIEVMLPRQLYAERSQDSDPPPLQDPPGRGRA